MGNKVCIAFLIICGAVLLCKLIPCTVEVERSGPLDGDEAKKVLIEIERSLHRSAHE